MFVWYTFPCGLCVATKRAEPMGHSASSSRPKHDQLGSVRPPFMPHNAADDRIPRRRRTVGPTCQRAAASVRRSLATAAATPGSRPTSESIAAMRKAAYGALRVGPCVDCCYTRCYNRAVSKVGLIPGHTPDKAPAIFLHRSSCRALVASLARQPESHGS